MRFLFWLALIGLVYFAIRSKLKAAQRNMQRREAAQQAAQQAAQYGNPANPSSPASITGGETMIVCSHCSVYFPASEAVRATIAGKELVFCSTQHHQQHAQQQAAPDSAP